MTGLCGRWSLQGAAKRQGVEHVALIRRMSDLKGQNAELAAAAEVHTRHPLPVTHTTLHIWRMLP